MHVHSSSSGHIIDFLKQQMEDRRRRAVSGALQQQKVSIARNSSSTLFKDFAKTRSKPIP